VTHPYELRWSEAFADLDDRPIHVYAAENVELESPFSIVGRFDISGSRHFIAPLEAWRDDRTREVNILKPPRGGGSLIGDLCFVWAHDNDPGESMDVFQKDDVAAKHWDDRLLKMLRANPRTVGLLPRDARQCTAPEIKLLNGHTAYVNGPGINNLQSKPIRYMRLDEPWLYKYGVIVEADARLGDFKKLGLSKLLCISQAGPDAGPLDEHEWFHHWQKGEANEWSSVCPKCGKSHRLPFAGTRADGTFWGVTWEKHKRDNGDWNVARAAASAHYVCPHGCIVIDEAKTRKAWNDHGFYELTNEQNWQKRGFRYEAIVDTSMGDLAAAFLECENAFRRGIVKPKLQFYQKYRAMFMDEQMLLRTSQRFARVLYDLRSKWDKEFKRFMSIDRQDQDQYWWTVRVFSKDGQSRRLGFGKAYGRAELEEIRKKFEVAPNHTTIDSAYEPKGDRGVYAACCEFGWIAVLGDAAEHFIHHQKRNGKTTAIRRSYSEPFKGDPESGTAHANRKFAIGIRFSKPVMNGRTQNLIDRGLWEEPAGLDGEMEQKYVEQMAGRIRKEEYNQKTGQTKIFWFESKNDHARDLANQQVLMATLCDILPDTLDAIEAGQAA
jgi:hypothetical protein